MPVFGLTCAKYQSGEIDRSGAISRCGDEMMRTMLYEAAQSLLFHSTRWSWLKAWAMQIAKRRGIKRAIVALAPSVDSPRATRACGGKKTGRIGALLLGSCYQRAKPALHYQRAVMQPKARPWDCSTAARRDRLHAIPSYGAELEFMPSPTGGMAK